MYNSGEVRSNRRMPDEWPELMVLANAALPETEFLSNTYPELHAMMMQVSDWDQAILDQNRYYAYNQLLCGIAQRLADPSRRERMIRQGAQNLLEWSSKDISGSGGISGLRHNSVALPFESLITEAYVELSPRVRLVGDLLTVASDMRGDAPPSSDEITTQISAATRVGGSRMHHRIDNVITGATTNLLDTVLMAASPGYRDGKVPSEQAMKLLRHPRLAEIAQHACGLRLENTTAQASFIQIEGNHISFVNPNRVGASIESEAAVQEDVEVETVDARTSIGLGGLIVAEIVEEGELVEEEETNSYNSREGSIICPAAHIKGMVPGVVKMVVEMIEIAVEDLKAKEAGRPSLPSI